jgi:hypothetical protein
MLAAVAALAAVPPAVVAQTYTADAAAAQAFLDCLEHDSLPAWRRLQARGTLLSNRVYRKVGEANAQPGVDWSVLVVSGVRRASAARRVIEPADRCAASTGARLVRAEIMRSTPASYHPAPAGRAAPPDMAFVVEFIAVTEDRAALRDYRAIMRSSIGPAVGRLVRENQFYSMVALETRRVIHSSGSALRWNQLHIRGYYPQIGTTPAAMTRYMQALNPTLGSFEQVFRRLDQIRVKPRDDIAREVAALSLPQ